MQDAWRAYLEVALGLTEAPRKKAQKAAGELLGRSGATAAQLQALAEDLMSTGMANREALTKLVRYEVDRTLGVVGLATAEEVADLTQRVHDLERQLRDALARATVAEAAAGITGPDRSPAPAGSSGLRLVPPDDMAGAGTGTAAQRDSPAPLPRNTTAARKVAAKKVARKVAGPVGASGSAPQAGTVTGAEVTAQPSKALVARPTAIVAVPPDEAPVTGATGKRSAEKAATKSGPTKAQPTPAESTKPAAAKVESTKAESTKVAAAKARPAKAESTKAAESAKPAARKASGGKVEPTTPEPAASSASASARSSELKASAATGPAPKPAKKAAARKATREAKPAPAPPTQAAVQQRTAKKTTPRRNSAASAGRRGGTSSDAS